MADGHKLDLPPQSGGMAHPAGLEPATLWFEARYSIQLNYGCVRTGMLPQG